RAAQEQSFNQKLIFNNINDINSKINATSEEIKALTLRKSETEAMLVAAKMDGLKSNLEAALITKQQCETALNEMRNTMAAAEEELLAQERGRMQTEQQLHPLRDKLEQARLFEQEARLNFEQCNTELAAVGVEESILAADLPASAKAATMD